MKRKEHYRIHIFGASGSGTSTVGKVLAEKLDITYFDFDDYYWLPSDPPFTKPREAEEKFRMIVNDTMDLDDFVISGHYAEEFKPIDDRLTHAIFIWVPAKIRQQRLRQRELDWFGDRVLPGGDMYDGHEAFVKWAGNYDLNNDTGRNIAKHTKRMKILKCPILKIEGDIPLDDILKQIINNL